MREKRNTFFLGAFFVCAVLVDLEARIGQTQTQQREADDTNCVVSDLTKNPRAHPNYLGIGPGEPAPKPKPGCTETGSAVGGPCTDKILELIGETGTVDGKELTILSAYWGGGYIDFEVSNFPALEYEWAGDDNFRGVYSNVYRITSAKLMYKDGTSKTVPVYNKVVRLTMTDFCKLSKVPTVSELLAMGK